MHIISEFINNEHLLSKIDVRIKIFISFIILALVLCSKGILFPLFIAMACIFFCIKMNVPARTLLVRFSEPLFIAAVLLFLKLFFSGNNALFSISVADIRITGYRDGLMDGLVLSSRILGAVSIVAVTGFATPFTELVSGLSWFRLPSQFIEILLLAYRYIFVLFEDAAVIYSAQKNRLGYSGIRRGLSSFGTLSGELTLRAFDRSQKTALAMAQRGYTGKIHAAPGIPFKTAEMIFAVLFVAAAGVLWKIM